LGLQPLKIPRTGWHSVGAWRALYELTPARLKRIQTARARVRRHVWSVLPDGLPTSKVADTELGEVVVLDVDAMIVVSHSEKQNAAPTFKGTFGFHPLGAWCDNTTELLAAVLRPGNAGANTAAELIEVLLAPRYGHWWSGRARRPRRPSETTDRREWT